MVDIWRNKTDSVRKILVMALLGVVVIFIIIILLNRDSDITSEIIDSGKEKLGDSLEAAENIIDINLSEEVPSELSELSKEVKSERLAERLKGAEAFLNSSLKELEEAQRSFEKAQAKYDISQQEVNDIKKEMESIS